MAFLPGLWTTSTCTWSKIAAALRDAENAESQAQQEIQEAQADAHRRSEVARASAQTAIQMKQNELRQVKAQLEGEAQSIEREAEVAAKTARATAERDLQAIRAQLEAACGEPVLDQDEWQQEKAGPAAATGDAGPEARLPQAFQCHVFVIAAP